MQIALLASVALVLLCFLPLNLALKCVVCNSFKDGENCAKWDTLSYIEDCPEGNRTFCAKIEQYTEGAKRTVRKCSQAVTDPGCIRRIGSDNGLILHCHCSESLCNASTRSTMTYTPSIIISALILATTLII